MSLVLSQKIFAAGKYNGRRGRLIAVIVNYIVDKNIYYGSQTKHSILLITTEYIRGNTVLAHVEQGVNLNIRVNNLLDYVLNKTSGLKKEHFFVKKSYNQGKAKAITRSTFEETLKRLDMSRTVIEQEILEDYDYTDKTGTSGKVQIAVSVKKDAVTAVIDFKDVKQYENFICPEWFV